MFSFFSRRKDTEIRSEDTIHQLRTPSPSVDSFSVDKDNSPKPPQTPSPAPSGLITDPNPLYSLISSVPPQILHEYTLSHLIPSRHRRLTDQLPPAEQTLTHLTSFFSSLVPPPKLHCVRCHNSYYDIENNDRSCHVHHDDDSAEVERVGRNKASEYETLYGCCGKTVEGDGDMGPPDGWCYEGKHTTDPKRARFRADSTPDNDKLVSCERNGCNKPPSSPSPSESSVTSAPRPRKRTRKPKPPPPAATEAPDQPDEAEEQEQDDDARSITSSKGKRKAPTVAKAPRKKRARKSTDEKAYVQPKGEEETDTDVEMEDVKRPRPKKSKPKPVSKSKTLVQSDARASPAPSNDSPNPPGRKSAMASSSSGLARKKSVVSFSPTATTVEVVIDPSTGKGVQRTTDTKGDDEPKGPGKKAKNVGEVISSSVDGEDW